MENYTLQSLHHFPWRDHRRFITVSIFTVFIVVTVVITSSIGFLATTVQATVTTQDKRELFLFRLLPAASLLVTCASVSIAFMLRSMAADWTPIVTETITPARALHDAGCTMAEIAAELGLTEAQVLRLPELADAALGPTHIGRIEQTMYAEALPGEVWSEKLDRFGEVHKLKASRTGDAVKQRTLLAALKPGVYGQQAQGIQSAVIINLIGVDRTAHVSVARVIEHEPADIEPSGK